MWRRRSDLINFRIACCFFRLQSFVSAYSSLSPLTLIITHNHRYQIINGSSSKQNGASRWATNNTITWLTNSALLPRIAYPRDDNDARGVLWLTISCRMMINDRRRARDSTRSSEPKRFPLFSMDNLSLCISFDCRRKPLKRNSSFWACLPCAHSHLLLHLLNRWCFLYTQRTQQRYTE